LPERSRAELQRAIVAGYVRVNGEVATESKHVVRKGDAVHLELPAKESGELSATNTPLKILYEGEGLLIIDKPAGMVVHPGQGFRGETLASALLYLRPDIHVVGEEGRPGIVHRLDKDTSGVILVATTPAMYGWLKDAFAERKVKKEYLALVLGNVEKPVGSIEAPIGKHPRDFRKQSAANGAKDPKPALTDYRVLEHLHLPGALDPATLVRVYLHTGRTHQIRVHFSSLGHPLVGDTLYGGRKAGSLFPRQLLHARRIEVRLPDGTWVSAESDIPQDFRRFLREAGSKFETIP
jgi:23S rRNA pseudouridine1911/1915/1917 synthase